MLVVRIICAYLILQLLVFSKVSAEETSFEIEDVENLGRYKKIENFPQGMKKIFGSCNDIICQGRIAGQRVYHRFVVKAKYSKNYPGKLMQAMAWYEIMYHSRLKNTDMFIQRYLNLNKQDYKEKKIDIKKIENLLSMNEARINMRSALGLDIKDDVELAIGRFWLLGEFLNLGKPKKRIVDDELNERKYILNQYKAAVGELITKLETENEKKDNEENNENEENIE